MGIDVRLETTEGEPVGTVLDFEGLFEKLVADNRDGETCCLRFVDPYGDTAFNRLQVAVFVSELQAVTEPETDPEMKHHLQKILNLAHRCAEELQTQLKFYGG